VRRRITIVAVRTTLMLGLGSAGMTKELFFVPKPDLVRVWVCIGLMLGPAVLEAWWRARNTSPVAEQPTRSSSSASS
jgi:hypothetical protein